MEGNDTLICIYRLAIGRHRFPSLFFLQSKFAIINTYIMEVFVKIFMKGDLYEEII